MAKQYLWVRYFSRFKEAIAVVLSKWITDGGDYLVTDGADNIAFKV